MTESLQSLKTKPGVVDIKGIGKPEVLKGTHEDAPKIWKSWSYKFETWFTSQWPTGQQALDYAKGKADDPVTADNLLDSTIADIDSIDAHLHVSVWLQKPYCFVSVSKDVQFFCQTEQFDDLIWFKSLLQATEKDLTHILLYYLWPFLGFS